MIFFPFHFDGGWKAARGSRGGKPPRGKIFWAEEHSLAGQSWYAGNRNAVITCGGAAPSTIIEGTRVRRIATTTNRTNRIKTWGSGWPGDVEQAGWSAAGVPPGNRRERAIPLPGRGPDAGACVQQKQAPVLSSARGRGRAIGGGGPLLAEGCGRNGDAESARFCSIARTSASELEYRLLLARDLHYLQTSGHEKQAAETAEGKRMLTALMQKLNADRLRRSRPRRLYFSRPSLVHSESLTPPAGARRSPPCPCPRFTRLLHWS